MKTLLPLLCLCLFALSTYARPPFKPVSYFDGSQIIGVKWYEFFIADNLILELYACTRQMYTSIGNGQIIAQYGQYVPGLNGAFQSALFIAEQQGNTGTYNIYDANNNLAGHAYVLDFDPCYEWSVFAIDYLQGDENDEILAISKSPQSLVALQVAIDLAEYYDFESHHLELQTSKCNYNEIFYQLKKERQNL